jgi:hypothetical protein
MRHLDVVYEATSMGGPVPEGWLKATVPFLRLIAPEYKVDSYVLLETAHKVLTFASTL